MDLSEYQRLPDSMTNLEVEKYCFIAFEESSGELALTTLKKLRELADRQWHTYELPSTELQNALINWLIQNGLSHTDQDLESVLVLSYCFGLDKEFFSKALSLYGGKYKNEFQRDIDHSEGKYIDPWWSLRTAQKSSQTDP